MKAKKNIIAALLLTAILVSSTGVLSACKNNSSKAEFNSSIDCGDVQVSIMSVYYAVATPDTDASMDVLMIRLQVKNQKSEILDFDPADYFALKKGETEYSMENIVFQPIKGYFQPNETAIGQTGFKIEVNSKDTYALSIRAEDKIHTLDIDLSSERIQSKCVAARFELNQKAKIDQLEITVTSAETVSHENPVIGKKYIKLSVHIQSVSAGAPSLISNSHFKLFDQNYKLGKIIEREMVDSLPTNQSAHGYFVFEIDEDQDSFILVISRHIKGEDAEGISVRI